MAFIQHLLQYRHQQILSSLVYSALPMLYTRRASRLRSWITCYPEQSPKGRVGWWEFYLFVRDGTIFVKGSDTSIFIYLNSVVVT